MENSKQPWELRSDDVRKEDKLATFIIFTEDKTSERLYFESFQTSNLKINVVENQKSKMENVFRAIKYCEQKKAFDKGIHVWCVFDRDFNGNPGILDKAEISFDESTHTAKRNNIKVAWSNDSFELWILLHYEDVDPKEPLLRNEYYERLTEILKEDTKINSDFCVPIVKGTFNYYDDIKSLNPFKNYILPILHDKTRRTAAIKRAEKLENHHTTHTDKPHEMCPCTMVHHLVKELLDNQ
mgnify:FL=1|jgi:hypothetical protein